MRFSPRALTIPAAAVMIAAAVPAARAQSVSPQFSYTRSDAGIILISDNGPARRAERPVRAVRNAAFDDIIDEQARVNGLNPVLVRAVIEAESAFDPQAVSRTGAMGLMQLMPGTARDLGVDDPFDPAQNIRGGAAYLRALLDRFDGDVTLALAAYNAGPGTVERYDSVPPYRETRAYVAKISHRIKDITAITRGGRTIYRVTEVAADGREVVKYTDTRPDVPHHIVSLRSR